MLAININIILIQRLPRRRQSTVHIVPLIGPLPRLKFQASSTAL